MTPACRSARTLVVPPGVEEYRFVCDEGEGALKLTDECDGLSEVEDEPLVVGDGGAKEENDISPPVVDPVPAAVGVEKDKSVAERDLLIE